MINTIFPLRECELFRSLDDEELSRIAILCSEIELPEGTRLIREGQPAGSLYIVTAGKIALHKSLGSHPSMVRGATTVSFCQPDQIVGWSALVEPYVYTLSATAWERSTLLVIQASLLRRAMVLNPDIGFRIMRCLSEVMSRRLHQVAQALTAERGNLTMEV